MLLSAIGGFFHGDVSTDHDVALDTDHSIDFDHDLSTVDAHGGGIEVSHDVADGLAAGDFWLAFVSLRFLTYFSGIFGIFGVALTLWSDLAAGVVLTTSLAAGLVLGYGGSLAFRMLKAEGETSGVTTRDYVGALGRTLVGIRASQPGKVRVSIKGDTIDMIALSEGDKDIAPGEEIVVVGLEGDRVRVAPKADYLD